MTETLLFFLLGGLLLVVGAEALVRGASRLALAVGISPLVVGLTVVAFGTSAPELAVSTGAATNGQGAVALGNVVGSNIFNVLVILGLSAIFAPLSVALQIVRREVPLMIGVSLLLLLFVYDGSLGRLEGGILFAGIIIYTVLLIRESRRANRKNREAVEGPIEERIPERPLWQNLLFIAVGLVGLVVGADLLVDSASTIARSLGMSELVVGLTIVAAGTSLPELATSVMASIRGERDIAVGNIVGSNIFNILVVLGAAGVVSSDPIVVPTGALTFDIPVMIAVAVATLPVFFSRLEVSRWEGVLFLLFYAFYLVHLLMTATSHPLLDEFVFAMTWFVLPLTVLTGVVVFVQRRSRHSRSRGA